MFNLFKNRKESGNLDLEKKQENLEEPVNQLELEGEPESLPDSEPIDIRLEALTNYFDQCEENGIEMTREMVETEIRERLGIEIEDLLGEEITNKDIKLTHQEIAQEISKIMSQKAENKGTSLDFLRKMFGSQFSRFAVVTLLLLLKFNPLQAESKKENTSNIKNKIETETKKQVNVDGGDDKTFKANIEDFNSQDGTIILSATNNFETDKADLKDAAKLVADFDNFLSSIDQDNFKNLINQDWVVKGSSDERKTSREGGNPKLTLDRISVVKSALEKTLKNHNFGDKLSTEQIKQLLEKQIKEVFPTGGVENGVTYLTDLINPISGQNYTEGEIKVLKNSNPAEYYKLLEKCRYTNFELEVKKDIPVIENKTETPPPSIIPEKPKDEPKIFSPKEYDEYYLLVDESPSMGSTKKNMSKELKSLNINKPFKVAKYSDDLSSISSERNSEQAAKKLMKMDTDNNASRELSFFSAIKFLEKIEKGQRHDIKKGIPLPEGVLYIATDETLQDVDKLEKLKELSVKTNIEVKILIFYSKGNKVLKLDIDELQKQMDLNNNLIKYGNRTVVRNLYDAEGKRVVLSGH